MQHRAATSIGRRMGQVRQPTARRGLMAVFTFLDAGRGMRRDPRREGAQGLGTAFTRVDRHAWVEWAARMGILRGSPLVR